MHSVREDLLRKVRMAAKVRVVRTASRTRFHDYKTPAARYGADPQPPLYRAASAVAFRILDQRFPVVVLGGVHRRARHGDAPGSRFHARFSGGRFSRATHAGIVHHAIRGAARGIHQHSRERSGEQRTRSARHALHLPRRTASPRHCPRAAFNWTPASGRINGYLPNIDITMESVAAFAGPLSIGVVLTGMGNDGAAGAKAIQSRGRTGYGAG